MNKGIKNFESFDDQWDKEETYPNDTIEQRLHDEIFNPRYGQRFNQNNNNDNITDVIKRLNDYTDEEKIEKFNSLYRFAETLLDSYRNNGGDISDGGTDESYDEIMSLLTNNRHEFWRRFNNIF